MIQTFSTFTKEDTALAGGKGANLGELTRAHCNVPPGFVITTKAYRLFIEENNLVQIIHTLLDSSETANLSAVSKNIQQKILSGSLPEVLMRELNTHTPFIDGSGMYIDRFAVRSSATTEDLDGSSFAGQQETYLNICTREELYSKIKACYASLWSHRAISYRQKTGFSHSGAELAVVVQKMVNSEKSGVLFTADIKKGRDNTFLINASFGLGESIVSGHVTPDEYECSKKGKLLNINIGSKERKVVCRSEGTKVLPVDEKMRSTKVLSNFEIKELCKEGTVIENLYKKPMDIEWAIEKGKLYILQARPITSTIPQSFKKPNRVKYSRRTRNELLFMLEKVPFVYYPLDYSFSMIAGKQKEKIFSQAGLVVNKEFKLNSKGEMILPLSGLRLNKNIIHIIPSLRSLSEIVSNKEKGEKGLEFACNETQKLCKTDIDTMNIKSLCLLMQTLYEHIEKITYERFRYAVFPGFLAGKKLQRYLKKINPLWSLYDLLGDLDYKTLLITKDLESLALSFLEDTVFMERYADNNTYSDLCRYSRRFKKESDKFLEKHGCKSNFNCYCFAGESLNENPDRLIHLLRPYMSAAEKKKITGKTESPYRTILKCIENKESKAGAENIISIINFYRFCHVYREESQYLWECCFEKLRSILRKLQIYFSKISEDNDLRYLFFEELTEACNTGSISPDLRSKINMRKENRSNAEKKWEEVKSGILAIKGSSIKGICGSSGTAQGKVCIVRGVSEFSKVQKGDILVCPYTDPEWTSLFQLVNAVVSDTGGSLSHAAIVAREFQIPAVLGTGCATSQLHDGDFIIVDGNSGRVTILENT